MKKERQKDCGNKVREMLKITIDEFYYGLSNMGWITTKRGIEKYSKDLIESNVFHISMKVQNSKEKKRKYFYFLNTQIWFLNVFFNEFIEENK